MIQLALMVTTHLVFSMQPSFENIPLPSQQIHDNVNQVPNSPPLLKEISLGFHLMGMTSIC